MSEERKLEIFYELVDYLCGLDSEKCVEILREVGVTKSEAEELEFFDYITEQLSEQKKGGLK